MSVTLIFSKKQLSITHATNVNTAFYHGSPMLMPRNDRFMAKVVNLSSSSVNLNAL